MYAVTSGGERRAAHLLSRAVVVGVIIAARVDAPERQHLWPRPASARSPAPSSLPPPSTAWRSPLPCRRTLALGPAAPTRAKPGAATTAAAATTMAATAEHIAVLAVTAAATAGEADGKPLLGKRRPLPLHLHLLLPSPRAALICRCATTARPRRPFPSVAQQGATVLPLPHAPSTATLTAVLRVRPPRPAVARTSRALPRPTAHPPARLGSPVCVRRPPRPHAAPAMPPTSPNPQPHLLLPIRRARERLHERRPHAPQALPDPQAARERRRARARQQPRLLRPRRPARPPVQRTAQHVPAGSQPPGLVHTSARASPHPRSHSRPSTPAGPVRVAAGAPARARRLPGGRRHRLAAVPHRAAAAPRLQRRQQPLRIVRQPCRQPLRRLRRLCAPPPLLPFAVRRCRQCGSGSGDAGAAFRRPRRDVLLPPASTSMGCSINVRRGSGDKQLPAERQACCGSASLAPSRRPAAQQARRAHAGARFWEAARVRAPRRRVGGRGGGGGGGGRPLPAPDQAPGALDLEATLRQLRSAAGTAPAQPVRRINALPARRTTPHA